MTQEEALFKIREKGFWDSLNLTEKEALQTLVPELRESDDEKIRKALIDGVRQIRCKNGITQEQMISYLEKQKAKERLDRMAPIYNDKESFESALEKAWKYYNESSSRKVDSFEDDYIECVFSKGFREGFLYKEKQKEQNAANNEEVEFTEFERSVYDLCPVLSIEEAKGTASDLLELAKKILLKTGKVVLASNYPEGCSFEDGFHLGYSEGFNAMKEQKPAEWNPTKEQVIALSWAANGMMENSLSASEMREELRSLYNDLKSKSIQSAEWSDTDNIGWDEAFACVTRAEKAAKNEEELQNAVTAEKWLKEIKFKYYVHPVKQEWNENDEKILDNLIRFYSREDGASAWRWSDGTITYGDVVNFLKSLRLQPKQEWSEEDEAMLNNLLYLMRENNSIESWEGCYEWLKSFRPPEYCENCKLKRSVESWKPTNEQMDALKHCGFGCYVYGDGPALRSLYNDLKKLM